jgi:hypothetical protein
MALSNSLSSPIGRYRIRTEHPGFDVQPGQVFNSRLARDSALTFGFTLKR